MNLKKLTIIICIIWSIIVSFWVIKSEYILITGKKVLLKTIPVDPKDLLMGDYVILNYDISRIPEEYKNIEYKPNEEVYVVLKTDENNIATIDKIETVSDKKEPLYIKGKISKCNMWGNSDCINYGIESYYVKEHTGKELENNLRNGAPVEISIDKNGNAKIRGFSENK